MIVTALAPKSISQPHAHPLWERDGATPRVQTFSRNAHGNAFKRLHSFENAPWTTLPVRPRARSPPLSPVLQELPRAPPDSPLSGPLFRARFAAWETCKENAQPLRRGRKVEALNAGLEAGAAKVSEVQKQEREKWESRLVAEANGGDPLDVWIKFIQWQQDTSITGGGPLQQQLLPMLERCAHTFKDDARYADDIRYLRVWIDYAQRVRDAEPIFDYLYARHIGQLHALFWISWAAVLESKRKLDEADKVLTRGELMRAQPAGRIKQKHAEFEARLMRKHILAPPVEAVEATPNGGGAASSRPSKERSALNRMSKREAAGPHRPTTQRAPAPLPRAPPTRPATAGAGSRGGGNGFLIFEDENQAPGTRELEDAPEPWEMGTATENAKENTGEATPWAGVTLPTSAPGSARPRRAAPPPPPVSMECPFAIHHDDQEEEGEGEEAHAHRHGGDAVREKMRPQLSAMGLLQATGVASLESHPLARFGAEALPMRSLDAAPPPPPLPPPPSSSLAPPPPPAAQPETSRQLQVAPAAAAPVASFRRDLLLWQGVECSFEEARARERHGYGRAHPLGDRAGAATGAAAAAAAGSAAVASSEYLAPPRLSMLGGVLEAPAAATKPAAPPRMPPPPADQPDQLVSTFSIFDDGAVAAPGTPAMTTPRQPLATRFDAEATALPPPPPPPPESAFNARAMDTPRPAAPAARTVCALRPIMADTPRLGIPVRTTAALDDTPRPAAAALAGGRGLAHRAPLADAGVVTSRAPSSVVPPPPPPPPPERLPEQTPAPSRDGSIDFADVTINTKIALQALGPCFVGGLADDDTINLPPPAFAAAASDSARFMMFDDSSEAEAEAPPPPQSNAAPFMIFDDSSEAEAEAPPPPPPPQSNAAPFMIFDDSSDAEAPPPPPQSNAAPFLIFDDSAEAEAPPPPTSPPPPASNAGPTWRFFVNDSAEAQSPPPPTSPPPPAAPFMIFDDSADTEAQPPPPPPPPTLAPTTSRPAAPPVFAIYETSAGRMNSFFPGDDEDTINGATCRGLLKGLLKATD